MKQVLRLSVVVGLMTFGLASQAWAIPSLQIIGCQGAICVVGAVVVGGPVNFTNVVVGDYTVSGSGAAVESAGQSNAQQTTINVSRTGAVNGATPLDVYVIANNYVLPNPPGSLTSTHGVTYTNVGGGASTAASVGFQGWYSPTAPAGAPPVIPAGAVTNGAIACTPLGNPNGSCSVNGAQVAIAGGTIPFSLITQTRFNIPVALANVGDTYGTTSQATVFPGDQTIVPEPASMLLLGTGLLGVARAARRRRNR